MIKKNWHFVVFAAFVFIVIALKWSFFGELTFSKLHWWNAQVLNYATAWYNEGFFFLKGALYDQAATVEFSDKASRVTNTQVFPLLVFPVFIVSKLFFTAPNPWMLSLFSTLLHLIFAFFSGSIAEKLMSDFKDFYRRVAFVCAAASALFIDVLFNMFTASYWTDHLCIVFILIAIWAEFKVSPKKKDIGWVFVQQICLILAALSDHYGLVFLILSLVYSLVKKEIWKVKALKSSLLIAGLCFLSYYHYSSSLLEVYSSAFLGLGYTTLNTKSFQEIISAIFISHLGFYALLFLLAFGVSEYLHRKKIVDLKFLIYFFLSPIVFSLLFADKAAQISFSSFKFFAPICVFFFGVGPALLLNYATSLKLKQKFLKNALYGLVLVVFCLPFYGLMKNYSLYLAQNNIKNEEYQILNWIKEHSNPENVIMSNFYKLNYYPPQGNYLIKKPVWQFGSFQGFDGWRKIFADTLDYPLLWLEKPKVNSEQCKPIYYNLGAKKVSEFQGIEAFLFPNLRAFVDMSLNNQGLCL